MLLFDQAKALEKSLGEEAAKVITDAFARTEAAIREQKAAVRNEIAAELATKADLEELRGEMREGLALVRGEIGAVRGELREDIAILRGDIKRLEILVKVLVGLSIIAIALFSPAAAELIKLLK